MPGLTFLRTAERRGDGSGTLPAEPLSPVGRHDVEGASLGSASHVPDDVLSNRSAKGKPVLSMHGSLWHTTSQLQCRSTPLAYSAKPTRGLTEIAWQVSCHEHALQFVTLAVEFVSIA